MKIIGLIIAALTLYYAREGVIIAQQYDPSKVSPILEASPILPLLLFLILVYLLFSGEGKKGK